MLGLIKKDFMLIRRQLRIIFIMIIFYSAIMSIGKSTDYQIGAMGGLAVSFMSVTPVTLLSYDEKYKWGRYSSAMPVSRREYVVSKYLVLLGLVAATAVIIGVFDFIKGLESPAASAIIIGAMALILGSFAMAISYKYGTNIARYIFMAVMFSVVLLVMLVAKHDSSGALNFQFLNLSNTISPQKAVVLFCGIAMAVYVLCLALSMRIYCRKDL